jgi:hypothetical protein
MLKKGYLQNQKLEPNFWFDKFQITETVGEDKYIYFI